jgi:hypothetical protein
MNNISLFFMSVGWLGFIAVLIMLTRDMEDLNRWYESDMNVTEMKWVWIGFLAILIPAYIILSILP